MLPLVAGGASRWYCTFKSVLTDADMQVACQQIGQAVGEHISGRERSRNEFRDSRTPSSIADAIPPLRVDIYLPSQFMDPATHSHIRRTIDLTAEHYYKALKVPKKHHERDEWNLKKLKDAPQCEACSWVVRDR